MLAEHDISQLPRQLFVLGITRMQPVIACPPFAWDMASHFMGAGMYSTVHTRYSTVPLQGQPRLQQKKGPARNHPIPFQTRRLCRSALVVPNAPRRPGAEELNILKAQEVAGGSEQNHHYLFSFDGLPPLGRVATLTLV